jgi:8-oxo-dGTP pyrophosphatase MutT (NUDIX family)
MSNPKLIGKHIHFSIYQEEKEISPGVFETHEYVRRRDGTRTIAIDSDNNILLTYEFRYELNGYDWRVPGGRLDYDDEPIIGAAQREFVQETGFVAENWEFLWTTTLDSTVRYQRHFFLATKLQLVGSSRDLGEKIDVHWIPLEKANEMALIGKINEEISALAIARLFFEIKEGRRFLG